MSHCSSKHQHFLSHSHIISQTIEYVKIALSRDSLRCTGHDWWHTYRVWRMAIHIAEQEREVQGGAAAWKQATILRLNGQDNPGEQKIADIDLFVLEMAALLHDVDDWKFRAGNGSCDRCASEIDDCAPSIVKNWLAHFIVDENIVETICGVIDNISFKGAGEPQKALTLEGQIVQDADRLDALGAIGIARAFAYGGYKGREIYNPHTMPQLHSSSSEYQKAGSTTINHFHEKLFFLKGLMNTKTARAIAEQRHQYLEQFLLQFLAEWNLF